MLIRGRILAELTEYQVAHGFPSTQRALAAAIGLSPACTVQYHLVTLATKGRLRLARGVARRLVFVPGMIAGQTDHGDIAA